MLMRSELLPRMKEHNNWTLKQYHQKNQPMKAQPIGASEQELGVTSVVAMEITMEQMLVIPCFVMTSTRPIRQGAA